MLAGCVTCADLQRRECPGQSPDRVLTGMTETFVCAFVCDKRGALILATLAPHHEGSRRAAFAALLTMRSCLTARCRYAAGSTCDRRNRSDDIRPRTSRPVPSAGSRGPQWERTALCPSRRPCTAR